MAVIIECDNPKCTKQIYGVNFRDAVTMSEEQNFIFKHSVLGVDYQFCGNRCLEIYIQDNKLKKEFFNEGQSK